MLNNEVYNNVTRTCHALVMEHSSNISLTETDHTVKCTSKQPKDDRTCEIRGETKCYRDNGHQNERGDHDDPTAFEIRQPAPEIATTARNILKTL